MAAGGVDSGGFVGSTFDTSHHQNNVHSSAGSGETYNGSSRLNTNTDTDTGICEICGLFFLVWCGAWVALAVFLALNASPYLAIPPLAMPVLMCICFVSVYHRIHQKQNALRNQPRIEGINVNINHDSSSHSAHPPQTSNVPLGFHDQSLHFATNYGFHATLNPGMQYFTASAGQTSQPSNVSTSMASDLPPSYEEVMKGKQTEGKFEGRL